MRELIFVLAILVAGCIQGDAVVEPIEEMHACAGDADCVMVEHYHPCFVGCMEAVNEGYMDEYEDLRESMTADYDAGVFECEAVDCSGLDYSKSEAKCIDGGCRLVGV